MIIAISIISFVLEGFVSNFISLNSLFMPLFTLMSLIIIFPYFNENIKPYLITSFIIGVFYDVIYTNTVVIHGLLFLLIAFVIIKLNVIFSNNWVNVMIMALICIIVYRITSFGILVITNTIPLNGLILLKSIYQSILLNLVFVTLAFIITDEISFKLKIKKSN